MLVKKNTVLVFIYILTTFLDDRIAQRVMIADVDWKVEGFVLKSLSVVYVVSQKDVVLNHSGRRLHRQPRITRLVRFNSTNQVVASAVAYRVKVHGECQNTLSCSHRELYLVLGWCYGLCRNHCIKANVLNSNCDSLCYGRDIWIKLKFSLKSNWMYANVS